MRIGNPELRAYDYSGPATDEPGEIRVSGIYTKNEADTILLIAQICGAATVRQLQLIKPENVTNMTAEDQKWVIGKVRVSFNASSLEDLEKIYNFVRATVL